MCMCVIGSHERSRKGRDSKLDGRALPRAALQCCLVPWQCEIQGPEVEGCGSENATAGVVVVESELSTP